MENRSYHGIEDRKTPTRGRMLRRNRWRAHAVPGVCIRYSGEHYAYHHRRDRGSRIDTQIERGALGRGTTDRVGVDPYNSSVSTGGSDRLSIDAESAARFLTISWQTDLPPVSSSDDQ